MSLQEGRRAIDAADDQLLDALQERAQAVAAVWKDKLSAGQPLHDAEREAAIALRLRRGAEARGLDPDAVLEVFALIVGRSFRSGPDSDRQFDRQH